MIVFNTFLKVLNKCKIPIILYTVILIFFGGFSLKSRDTSTNFIAQKPDVFIVNKDKNQALSDNLIKYLEKNCNIKSIDNNKDALNDALFYRDLNYIIYIPKNYSNNLIKGKDPEIKIKSTGDYNASYTEFLLNRYIKSVKTYSKYYDNEQDIIEKVNNIIDNNSKIEISTKLDTENLSNAATFYNFANYSFMAGCIYVICLILSSFKEENITKRTIISAMNYKKHFSLLMISNALFVCVLWAFYVLLSFIIIKDIMFTMHGMIYILNSFVFAFCCLTIAFLINNIIINKNAINGIINVIALGSSFLCGAFVPVEFLPDIVLKAAHILPSFWYINTNNALVTLNTINMNTLKPIIFNMIILIGFSIVFIALSMLLSRKNRKIG